MEPPAERKLISIICPVFNEEEAVPLFYARLNEVLVRLRSRYEFEVLFTNNRSTDHTLQVIRGIREADRTVQVLTLSRNFGYQASVQAGISYAGGDAIIAIDVDCEDPPELIEDFLAKWEEGFDVVYGIRFDREESWVMKKARNLFYRILRVTADMDIVLYMAEFALIGSTVRDAIINNRNTYPFLRSEIGYAGFARYGIKYKRQPRIAGRTHYNFARMLTFGIGGILTSSTVLMRLGAYSWPIVALASVICVALDLEGRLAQGFQVAVVGLLLYISFFLMAFGLYIARIYKNGMKRPIFIVDLKESCLNSSASGLEARLSVAQGQRGTRPGLS
jgi:glycosyltransferase involved in cell wall biosynthesis